MAAQRIRGQETILSILSGGELESEIESITETEFTHNLDLQEENYLSETSPRFDQIFKGTSFRLSGHMARAAILRFADKIVAKAGRQGGALRFDITTTFIFDDEAYTIAFEDCSFGSVPFTSGSREDFVSWSLEGSCSKGREVT